MTMRLMKETIQLEHLAGTGRDTAVVEGSMTLPGGLREAAHVLYSGADAAIERTEAMQDRVNVSGRVTFRTLYTQGAPEKISGIEGTVDFSHMMDLPGAAGQGACRVQAQVTKVEAATAGGQLTVRAWVALTGQAVVSQSVEALTGIAEVDGLQVRTAELNAGRTVAAGSGEAMLREEFELPSELRIRETLFATAVPQVEEVTGGAGRAGLSGQVRLEVYHASSLPESPVVVTRHTIAFTESVDLTGEEGETLAAAAVLRDVAVASQDSGDDARILRAEVLLGLEARSERRERMTVLQDAYTTAGDELRLTCAETPYRTEECCNRAAESGKSQLILGEGTPPVRSVPAAFAIPEVTQLRRSGARLAAEGVLHATLIAMPAEGAEPLRITVDEPFRQTFAVPSEPDDRVTLTVTDMEASAITGDRVELRYVMHLSCEGTRSASALLVTGAAPAPAAPMDGSIVLYFVQPEETLWEIAKRYRVSIADIRQLNPDLGEEVHAGQGILVWRRCPEGLCV